MPRVCFTANLQRHVACPEQVVAGDTVASALDAVFAQHPRIRNYILDEQGTVRRHMAILVNGQALRDRQRLQHPVAPSDEIHILQALSGG